MTCHNLTDGGGDMTTSASTGRHLQCVNPLSGCEEEGKGREGKEDERGKREVREGKEKGREGKREGERERKGTGKGEGRE